MKCIAFVVMLVVASTNASLVSHVGLATSPHSHNGYSTFQARHYSHVIPLVSHQQQHKSGPFSHIHRLAAPYDAYTTVRLAAPPPPPAKYRTPSFYTSSAAVWKKSPAKYTAPTSASFHQATFEGHKTKQALLNVELGTW